MNIKNLIPALLAVAFAGISSASSLSVVNSDFSAVTVACGVGYAYQSASVGADCTGPAYPQQDFNANPAIGWTFTGGSGITGPGTAFNPPDFAGLFSQAALLQDDRASVAQNVGGFLDTETYTASFYLGSRYNNSNDGNQTVDVKLDGILLNEYTLSTGTPFTLVTTDAFTTTAGSHVLSFEGTASGDHTAFFSNVSISGSSVGVAPADPTPEPATFALIGCGLAGVFFVRRKRA